MAKDTAFDGPLLMYDEQLAAAGDGEPLATDVYRERKALVGELSIREHAGDLYTAHAIHAGEKVVRADSGPAKNVAIALADVDAMLLASGIPMTGGKPTPRAVAKPDEAADPAESGIVARPGAAKLAKVEGT